MGVNMMVEPTQANWDIYDQLCELEAELSVNPENREDILALARNLCKEIEVN